MEYCKLLKLSHDRWKLITLKWGVVLLFFFFCFNANSQPNLSGYNEVSRQRLLIRITAQYIHTISQGQIDMDSAIRIPCKLYRLSPLLAYNEGYDRNWASAGAMLIDAGKITEAKVLLKKSNGEERLKLLIELGTYFVFKPGNAKPDLVEASKFIDQALLTSKFMPLKWRMESMSLQGQMLQQSGQQEDSRKVFAEVIKLAGQSNDKAALGRALLTAGGALHYGDPDRLDDFEKAFEIFKELNDKEKAIECVSQMIIENFVAKRYDIAEKLSIDIIKREKDINFYCQQYSFDALAYINNRKGQLTRALEYSNKCLEAIHSRTDSAFIGYFYVRRGLIFERMLKNQEAMLSFDKALTANKGLVKLYWIRPVVGKVNLFIRRGTPGDALSVLKSYARKYSVSSYFEKMHYAYLLGLTYDHLHQIKPAEENYQQFLEMAKVFPVEYVHDEFPEAYYEISTFYRVIGKTKIARKLLEQGKAFTTDQDLQGIGQYYQNLFKIDSLEGQYLNAIKDIQKSNSFTDSAFSNDQIKKARELLIKYETEKKDKNIKLLNSQKQVAQIKAEEATRTKNITLGGLVLLIIIILLLISLYVNKRKANGKLEANRKEMDQKNTYLEKINTDKDKLLKEKEWLLKEVHHRVKNNLQMVTSLLYSQAVYLEDGAAKLAVNDSLRRMQAMSLIHQKLYQDQNTSVVAMPEYINDLVRYLHESFDAENKIVFEQNIKELNLDVSQAIPLGLIVTESIVNAIKYAFLNEQKGVVKIVLQYDGPDLIKLRISDNGIGLPDDFDTMEHNSLGLDLMQGLARQLKGDLDIETNNGVHITLKFKTLTN